MRTLGTILTTALIATTTACSAVQTSWVRPGYAPAETAAVKRIAVVAWAEPTDTALAKALGQIAADRIKLKLDYLVVHSGVMARGWSDACAELEGVLSIRALAMTKLDGNLDLDLVAELHDCRNGALIWRTRGSDATGSADDDLARMTETYVSSLGAGVEPYIAPVFLMLRDMLASLPNPTLSDEEILEKIELE